MGTSPHDTACMPRKCPQTGLQRLQPLRPTCNWPLSRCRKKKPSKDPPAILYPGEAADSVGRPLGPLERARRPVRNRVAAARLDPDRGRLADAQFAPAGAGRDALFRQLEVHRPLGLEGPGKQGLA
jgi:hypothetical protein